MSSPKPFESGYANRAERVNPQRDLAPLLNAVESPGRYVGGEFGAIVKPELSHFRVALTFPDLYEIGMSNTAIKLIYGMLNSLPDVACERVFVPAPDFEEALNAAGVPLYTLETGTPVAHTDLVAVSYGYELLATNLLTVLNSSGIALHSRARDARDPLVLVGGPGATNPMPLAPFVDGVFVGEAEAALPTLVTELARARRNGAGRDDLLAILADSPAVWVPRHEGPQMVRRVVWSAFGTGAPPPGVVETAGVPASFGAGFPVPSIPVVQDHGVVEIMRGCPQGCRFCHAGVYYRPYRMKPIAAILDEVEWLVSRRGYRDISLSSLSTGDYHDLLPLLEELNRRYRARGVSFQLPSLRVNSVTLPIIEQLSGGRKSGLTFAVESGSKANQRAMNKLVPLERTAAIAREAMARGWRHAKLYFMIGLPVPDPDAEAMAIVDYVRELRRAARMDYVVNVGAFVPKPHTPFERVTQLDPGAAERRLEEIRRELPRGTKLRSHDPWLSWLEGVLTRGDERTAEAIERAFRDGARLDAWSEHMRRDIWETAIRAVPGADRGVAGFPEDAELPWSDVSLGVTRTVLARERRRAAAAETSAPCGADCGEPCGVCNRSTTVRDTDSGQIDTRQIDPQQIDGEGDGTASLGRTTRDRRYRVVIRYRKRGSAAFLPHLAVVRSFEKSWHRIGIPLELTEGFHPKPRMSFGQPLPLGVESDDELVVLSVQKSVHIETIYQAFDAETPSGFAIRELALLGHDPQAPRIPAPMQQFHSSMFRANPADAAAEARLRDALRDLGVSLDEGLEFRLSHEHPGLGRIIKAADLRSTVRFLRLETCAPEGVPLFQQYAALANVEGIVRESDNRQST